MSVGVGQSFLGIAGYITVVRDVEGDVALSHRWILHALHDMRRFLGRPEHGHDDTIRTDVQHASNMVVGVRRRANHDWEVACAKARDRACYIGNAETGVIHIHEDEVDIGGGDDLAEAGLIELKDRRAELEFPVC